MQTITVKGRTWTVARDETVDTIETSRPATARAMRKAGNVAEMWLVSAQGRHAIGVVHQSGTVRVVQYPL